MPENSATRAWLHYFSGLEAPKRIYCGNLGSVFGGRGRGKCRKIV